MIGRRGPVQAAFTNPEIKELGELADAEVDVRADELILDAASQAALASGDDKSAEKNLETLRLLAAKPKQGRSKTVHIRFLRSPVELLGQGRVEQMVLGENRLVAGKTGDVKAEPTGKTETLPTGLVFRSVGYLGTGVPGAPFDARRGVIPNERGRVVTAPGTVARGEYAVGWIKRGPSGVIGTTPRPPRNGRRSRACLPPAASGSSTGPGGSEWMRWRRSGVPPRAGPASSSPGSRKCSRRFRASPLFRGAASSPTVPACVFHSAGPRSP
jgi:hypothetical protein